MAVYEDASWASAHAGHLTVFCLGFLDQKVMLFLRLHDRRSPEISTATTHMLEMDARIPLSNNLGATNKI